MSIRRIATATALLALVAAAPAFAQSQPAEQPQAGQSQDGSQQPADQQTQEKK